MDILKKYNEKKVPRKIYFQDPVKARPQVPSREPPGTYHGLVYVVMRVSGGIIKDQRQANAVLVILIVAMITISGVLLTKKEGGGNTIPFPGTFVYTPGQPARFVPTAPFQK